MKRTKKNTAGGSLSIEERTKTKPRCGGGATSNARESLSLTRSMPSALPPKDLKEPYQRPAQAQTLTHQVNDVATKVLNEEIDLDTARVYSALVRSMSQLISVEVVRAKMTKTKPNLDI